MGNGLLDSIHGSYLIPGIDFPPITRPNISALLYSLLEKPKENWDCIFHIFKEPRNWIQGIDSASLRSLAGRYNKEPGTRKPMQEF
jgi:hypothetical protein